MRTASFAALVCAAALTVTPAYSSAARDAMFLDLVKERHLPPLSVERWGRHIGADCIWVGKGLGVATRADVSGQQIDTGKRVEIKDFTARDYGNVAVLTYLVVEHQPQAGREITTRLRKMDTYASRDGEWQLIANAEVVGKPDRVAIAFDPKRFDNYAGTYETMMNGRPIRTRIWREGSKLMAQTEGQAAGEMLPLSPTLFFDAATPEDGGPENIFVLDASGRATEWTWREGAVEFKARRLPDAP